MTNKKQKLKLIVKSITVICNNITKLFLLFQECVREIILRLTDYRDLEASSAAWNLMSALVAEQRVWRELTEFHFTAHQIGKYLEKKGIDREQADADWQDIYHALRK